MQPLSGEINVIKVASRATLLMTLVNVYRLLLTMKQAVPEYAFRDYMRPGVVQVTTLLKSKGVKSESTSAPYSSSDAI